MRDITRILNDEILPRLNRAEVFKDLDPKDKGDYLECTCPGCGCNTAFVYKDSTYLKCNRLNECNYSTTIYNYLSGVDRPRGEEWWKTTQKLASMTGVTLPEHKLTDEDIKAQVRRNELESIWEDCRANKEMAEDYLASRGLAQADVGFMDSINPWGEHWNYRVILPVRDRYGNLVGLIGRDTTGDADKKYLYSVGCPLKEIGFIGLDVAAKERTDTIIVVEGVIDRIRLNLAGVKNVVACGNASVSKDRLELLTDLGYRKIILALDNDEAGKNGTRDAIERAYELLIPPEIGVHVYQHKDADEDLADGIAFPGAALHAHVWLAHQYIERYPDYEQLIEAVIRFDETITNPLRIAHLALHFFPEIQGHIGFEKNLLELYEIRRQRNTQKKSHDLIQNAAKRAAVLGNEGKHEEAKEALFEGYRQSEALLRQSTIEPVRTLNERLLEHEEQIMAYRDREILGLKTGMVALTEALMGLRGLIFLGGPPNLGKTVLSMQLALQALIHEPEVSIIYINLDMDTNDVITRIRCNIGEFEWKKYTQGHSIPVDAGRDRVRTIGNRLIILDEKCFNGEVQEVIDIVNSLKAQSKTSRTMIVLDYLQVWPVPEEKRRILRSENDLDEWRVAVAKQLKGSIGKHDAVIVVSEVRKEAYNRELSTEDLKGSSRLSYAGDVVLLLQRLTFDEYCENFELSGGGLLTYSTKRNIDDIKKDQRQNDAKKIQEFLENQTLAVGWLQVAKGRDGTLRKKIPVTAHFKTATIIEGWHIDGVPKEVTQGVTNDRHAGMEQGALQEHSDERKSDWWQK